MTLNDHFALKSVSGSPFNGLPFWLSKLSEICRPKHYAVSGRNVAQVTGDISFMGLFTGVP